MQLSYTSSYSLKTILLVSLLRGNLKAIFREVFLLNIGIQNMTSPTYLLSSFYCSVISMNALALAKSLVIICIKIEDLFPNF